MVCTPFSINGARGFVCGPRRPRPRCVGCGKPAPLLCDWKVERRSKKATCDAPICAACALEPALEKHLCPTHAAEWKGRQRG